MDFHFKAGHLPLLVSMPHAGLDIPDQLARRMTPAAQHRADTDWHLVPLYGFLQQMGASTLAARWSRYVVDLNRPPEDGNLYPGQDSTGLCPLDTFDKQPLYRPGQAPDEAEVQQRLAQYWQPYHRQLQSEIDRLLQLHGVVLLWDAHSIKSVVPRFFDGKLADLNFGTADGTTCAVDLMDAVLASAASSPSYSCVHNGRFKGGYITRHYGEPALQVHAIQLEMAQCIYMNETAPYAYRPDLAQQVQSLLQHMLAAAVDWASRRAA
jgi:N-formylglutamate deformylase